MEECRVFLAAANWCADTVARIPSEAWDQPGLGEWDIRSLVGHTSRSLSTVVHAVNTPSDTADLATAEDYFIAATTLSNANPEAVRDRGFAAGRDLGDNPSEQFHALLAAARGVLDDAVGQAEDPMVTSVAGGVRLSQYLRTRIFELVVHGLDIQAALSTHPATKAQLAAPPQAALHEALRITQNLAVLRGDGAQTLFAMTGRAQLPAGYSVLA